MKLGKIKFIFLILCISWLAISVQPTTVDEEFAEVDFIYEGLPEGLNLNKDNIVRNLHPNVKYLTNHVYWKSENKLFRFPKIKKEFFCPPEWKLENELCIKQVSFPPHLFCPKDAHRDGDKCIIIRHPDFICPKPFELQSHKQCVFIKTFPAKLLCLDHEEIFDEKENCCKKKVHLPPKCPDHYHWRNGKCIKIFESKPFCPTGFDLAHSKNKCIKKFKVKAEFKCPENSKYYDNDDECIATHHPPPRCPKHYDFDKKLNKCIKKILKVPLPCPKDWWKYDDKFCEKKKKYPAEKYCPENFEFDEKDDKCKKEIPLPPKCPPGYTRSRNKKHEFCEKLVQEKAICPPGTEPVEPWVNDETENSNFDEFNDEKRILKKETHLKCKRREEHELSIVCPHGFELIAKDKCKKVEWFPPRLSCKDDCFIIKKGPVLFACPEGTKFVYRGKENNHEKEHNHIPSCIREVKGEVCKPQIKNCNHHFEEVDKKDRMRRLGDKEENECHELPPICKPVKKVEFFPAKPYCPDGGELEGHKACIFKQHIYPKKICDKGKLDEAQDRCKIVYYKKPKEKCLHGSYREGKVCVSWEFFPPTLECPKGSELNENKCCIIKKPLIPATSYWHYIHVLFKCPDNQKLDHKWCIKIKKMPIKYVCPPKSYEDKDLCILKKDLIFPEPIEKKFPPIWFCHKGALCDQKWCEIVEEVHAIPECPKNSELVDKNDCIKIKPPIHVPPKWITTSPIPKCPKDASVFGTKCVITKKTEPIPKCPHDFEWIKGKCVKKIHAKPICPEGSLQHEQHDGKHKECVKLIKSHAKIKIVHGCVFEVESECHNCLPIVEGKCTHE